MASERADKSVWLVAEDFDMRHRAASRGTLFPTQLLTNSFLCPKCAANFHCGEREEDPKWLHFNLWGICWQAASAWLKIPWSRSTSVVFMIAFSMWKERRAIPFCTSGTEALDEIVDFCLLYCLAHAVSKPFPRLWSGLEIRIFFFLPAALALQWRMSYYPEDKCVLTATSPQEVRSWFRLLIVFQSLIWISLPSHIWFLPDLPFPAL